MGKFEDDVMSVRRLEAAKEFDRFVAAYGRMVLADTLEEKIATMQADIMRLEKLAQDAAMKWNRMRQFSDPLEELEKECEDKIAELKKKAKISEKNFRRMEQIVKIAHAIEKSSGR